MSVCGKRLNYSSKKVAHWSATLSSLWGRRGHGYSDLMTKFHGGHISQLVCFRFWERCGHMESIGHLETSVPISSPLKWRLESLMDPSDGKRQTERVRLIPREH